MLYIGVDVHKKNLEVCSLDESGESIERCKIANELDSVVAHFGRVSLPVSIAIEPTHNWAMLYDTLEQLGMEVHVAHPRETELIGKSKVKTDRVTCTPFPGHFVSEYYDRANEVSYESKETYERVQDGSCASGTA